MIGTPKANGLGRKTALVTGSTSGIGLGIARSLASAGMNIMLNGLCEPGVAQTLKEDIAREHSVEVAYSPADMTRPGEITDMIQLTVQTFGAVDVLINNAGIQHVAEIESFPPEKWDAIIAINLSSAFHTIRNALPHMKAKQWGRIVNIASAHGLVASPYKSAYVAAKHGILGLTKTVALEAAKFGVTVNAVCPGYVLTPLVEMQIPQTAVSRGISEEEVVRDVLLRAQPTGRFVTIEQVGEFVAFLCSEGASSITGAALPIDGGWTAQ